MYQSSKKLLFLLLAFLVLQIANSNAQKSSAEIFLKLKKLDVVGSVLYIAAHPDDENNSFLPFLTNDRMYRTAYLSLTRGDGGQNLLGKEQGIELGLIRTKELLAARQQDGAEQYFSRAYEFGFSKSAEEALAIWDHQQVLSDAVWVIRKFQPDIIIARFPPDARAGHGHHAASAIIAKEAFIAAADPKQFPEQFKYGVTVWQAKRILWNTFNFGGANTTNDQQLKIEVGGYNALIGKNYGEIGGEARSMHKSQGEGRPRRRGSITEYFDWVAGDKATKDIMDGVNTSWTRLNAPEIHDAVSHIVQDYKVENPEKSVKDLVQLYKLVNNLPSSVWKNYKLDEIKSLVQACAGLFMDATSSQQQVFPGKNLPMQFSMNPRTNVQVNLGLVQLPGRDSIFNKTLAVNQNLFWDHNYSIPLTQSISQPYWLVSPKTEGMFVVNDQQLIGQPENDPAFTCKLNVTIENQVFEFQIPVQYKYVDPTKGEVYQPIVVVPGQEIKYEKELYLMNGEKAIPVNYQIINHLGQNESKSFLVNDPNVQLPTPVSAVFQKTIQYDHISTITYFPTATTTLVKTQVNTKGKKIGYIDGAGDKIPEALVELGYSVTYLKPSDFVLDKLKSFDAIIVGIRAYNLYEYLTTDNEELNKYIEQGGNVIVQYLKSNQVGLQKIKVGPYPFIVNSGRRVTQENVPVTFALPQHVVLNSPNKITATDFENWVQERSTYQAENADALFEMPFRISDKGEAPSNGSLLIAPYGKGNFVYLSLTLFRQLPAGNPGAFKLLANLIALPKH
ncbi:MAG: PIG-L family deacetylase [Chitinophagaceae bacterium]|nr:PIG-L family deacetylase [Chitinophagaceae bacterium]